MKANNKKIRRKIRVRAKVKGTKDMPRLSVYRSTRYLYGQVIDDQKGITLVGVSEKHLGNVKDQKRQKSKLAHELGMLLAKKALQKKNKDRTV